MKLFTFHDGKVQRYFLRKDNKIALTKERYIATPTWFPAHLKFSHNAKHIDAGTLISDENQLYLIPDSPHFRDFSALVIAKSVRKIKHQNAEVLYSSMDKSVFLLKFPIGGNAVINDFYVFWDGKNLIK